MLSVGWALFAGLLAACGGGSGASPEAGSGPSANRAEVRLVTVGGSVSEIVCALGAQGQIVGVDETSVYPASLRELPKVGNARALSAEGILSLRPTKVVLPSDAGPPTVVDQLRGAGIDVVVVQAGHSVDAAIAKVDAIGAAIGRAAEARSLATRMRREIADARSAGAATRRTKVLFVYARGAGTLMVSGRGTAADAMIALAGAENTVTEFDGYRPLTAEAAVAAAPDVVLLTAGGAGSLGGTDGVLGLPGLTQTPAGRARRVVAFDDALMLGFGPRLGAAIAGLSRALGSAMAPAADADSGGSGG